MEGRLLFRGCTLVHPDGAIEEDRSVVIEGPRVTQVVPREAAPTLPGDWAVAADGRALLFARAGPLSPRPVPAGLSASEAEALFAFELARGLRAGIAAFEAPGNLSPAQQAGWAAAVRRTGAVVGEIAAAPPGRIAPGAQASLVLYDDVPLPGGTPSAAVVEWARRAPVAWVVVEGRVAVREGQLLGADYLELAHAANAVLRRRPGP